MRKILFFTMTAVMLLGILTGCSEKGNVSTNKDGMITEASEMVEDLTDMFTESTTEPTTEKRTTQATEHDTTGTDVIGESEPTEDTSSMAEDNARNRRSLR